MSITEAQLTRFNWWLSYWKAGMVSMDELRRLFGKELSNGLVKPMSRAGVNWRISMAKQRGLPQLKLDKGV